MKSGIFFSSIKTGELGYENNFVCVMLFLVHLTGTQGDTTFQFIRSAFKLQSASRSTLFNVTYLLQWWNLFFVRKFKNVVMKIMLMIILFQIFTFVFIFSNLSIARWVHFLMNNRWTSFLQRKKATISLKENGSLLVIH